MRILSSKQQKSSDMSYIKHIKHQLFIRFSYISINMLAKVQRRNNATVSKQIIKQMETSSKVAMKWFNPSNSTFLD